VGRAHALLLARAATPRRQPVTASAGAQFPATQLVRSQYQDEYKTFIIGRMAKANIGEVTQEVGRGWGHTTGQCGR
jgi:hypothetical protein